jgi:hypothetical protein
MSRHTFAYFFVLLLSLTAYPLKLPGTEPLAVCPWAFSHGSNATALSSPIACRSARDSPRLVILRRSHQWAHMGNRCQT